MVTSRWCGSKEIIFNQGDLGTTLHIIIAGTVSVMIRNLGKAGDTVPASSVLGAFVPIVDLNPGSFFGEMSLVHTSHRRSARAVVRVAVDFVCRRAEQRVPASCVWLVSLRCWGCLVFVRDDPRPFRSSCVFTEHTLESCGCSPRA